MKMHRWFLALAPIAVMACGCTAMGTGIGSTATGASPTTFNWTSSDGVSGTLTATQAGGPTYSGQYFQITKDTTVEGIAPLWATGWGGRGGWHGRGDWGGWDYWDADPSPDFITHYSGRVVANLVAPDGSHMRCQFQLAHPSDGMNGGGLGQCQLPDGPTIQASFPHH
jgi:hypothetical protein